jgi:hypothetical protein
MDVIPVGSYRIAVSILANVLRGTSGPLVWHYSLTWFL